MVPRHTYPAPAMNAFSHTKAVLYGSPYYAEFDYTRISCTTDGRRDYKGTE